MIKELTNEELETFKKLINNFSTKSEVKDIKNNLKIFVRFFLNFQLLYIEGLRILINRLNFLLFCEETSRRRFYMQRKKFLKTFQNLLRFLIFILPLLVGA